jgi:hypothetical protein
VNTDAHYDHTFGNARFGPASDLDAPIYGQEPAGRCRCGHGPGATSSRSPGRSRHGCRRRPTWSGHCTRAGVDAESAASEAGSRVAVSRARDGCGGTVRPHPAALRPNGWEAAAGSGSKLRAVREDGSEAGRTATATAAAVFARRVRGQGSATPGVGPAWRTPPRARWTPTRRWS